MRYLCLDTGGTSIKYAVCNEQGEGVALKRRPEGGDGSPLGREPLSGSGYPTGSESSTGSGFPTNVESPSTHLCVSKMPVGKTLEEFLDHVEKLYRDCGDIDGIACSFPGEVHSEEGVILGISAVEQLHEVPLKQMISERCGGLRVTMLNDANAAAMGELWKGVGRSYKNIAFVIVGSGVGGAVVENGLLYPGTTKNKAEIGNFPMGGFRDGRLMAWSDFTLEKEVQRYNREHGACLDGKELIHMARCGDLTAAEYIEEFLHYMAVGCISVEFAYDPEIIAIGGGISADEQIIEEIRQHYSRLVEGQRMGYLRPKIAACEQGNNANLLGALYYYLTI